MNLKRGRPALCGVELRKRDSRSKAHALPGRHHQRARTRVEVAWLSVINLLIENGPVVRAAKRNDISTFEHHVSDDAPVAQRLERHASPNTCPLRRADS